jgi:hypothetical protein
VTVETVLYSRFVFKLFISYDHQQWRNNGEIACTST